MRTNSEFRLSATTLGQYKFSILLFIIFNLIFYFVKNWLSFYSFEELHKAVLYFLLLSIYSCLLIFIFKKENENKLSGLHERFASYLDKVPNLYIPFHIREKDKYFKKIAGSYNKMVERLIKANVALNEKMELLVNSKISVKEFQSSLLESMKCLKLHNITNYEYLVLQNRSDIIEYEKLLFKSFTDSKYTTGWVAQNYIQEDEHRIRPCIAYDRQKIYAIKENSTVVAALSVNLNLAEYSQVEHLGFNHIPNKSEKSAEVLNFISHKPVSLRVYKNILQNLMYEDLRTMNINTVYASCSSVMLNAYKRFFDFSVVEFLQEKDEYLLITDIS